MTTPGDFRGAGWSFPIVPDAGGGLGYVDGDAGVEQSLVLLLRTAVGERVMRPDFGTAAPRLVFAPGSRTNLGELERSVGDAVRIHEPRVRLLSVTASPAPADPTRVDVTVTYTVRRTNTRRSVVYPYYLDRVGGPP